MKRSGRIDDRLNFSAVRYIEYLGARRPPGIANSFGRVVDLTLCASSQQYLGTDIGQCSGRSQTDPTPCTRDQGFAPTKTERWSLRQFHSRLPIDRRIRLDLTATVAPHPDVGLFAVTGKTLDGTQSGAVLADLGRGFVS